MDCCETPGWRSLVERSHSAGGGPICLAFQAPFQGTLKKNRGGKLNCHGSNGSSRNCLGSPLLVGSVSPVLLFCWSELGGDQTKPHGRSIDLRRGGGMAGRTQFGCNGCVGVQEFAYVCTLQRVKGRLREVWFGGWLVKGPLEIFEER